MAIEFAEMFGEDFPETAVEARDWLNDLIYQAGTVPTELAHAVRAHALRHGLSPLMLRGHDCEGLVYATAANDDPDAVHTYLLPWQAIEAHAGCLLTPDEIAAGIALWLHPAPATATT